MSHFDKNIHMKDYIAIMRRRKWVFVTFFLITVISVTIATFIQKNIYRATSTVIVDVESPDVLSVKDVVKLGETNYFAYRDYIETQQEIIRSRRTAHAVIKNLNLANKKELKESKDPIQALLKKLHVELIRDTRILKISVDDEDPEVASCIANEFARVYADSNIALKIKTSNQAQSWLRREVKQQENRVRDIEIKLQEYKERNNLVSIESQKNIINDLLVKLNANYIEAQTRRIQAETAYNSLVDSNGNVTLENLPTVLSNNKILQTLKEDYLKQEALLAEYRKVYKDKHPKMIRLFENINYFKSRIKNEIETNLKTAKEEEDRFKIAIEEERKKALMLERKIIHYNALNRELETNERILQIVLNRLRETSIAGQIETNNVRVQDLAETPQIPIRPKKILNIALSIIVGIIGGAGLAFFREYMDTTLRDPRDIAILLQLTVLGSVPRIRFNKKIMKHITDIDRIVEKDPHSLVAESYRLIRTSLLFSLGSSNTSATIVITSSVPREGKTLTAVNLAILLANSGERVLLVDADMRKSRIHTVFNDKNESGFSHFLLGEKDFESVIKYSGIDNLYFVTSGASTHKPSELISSKNTNIFLEKAKVKFSKVIIDTPPVAIITDAAILSSMCDGVVLVAEGSRTTENLLNRSKELLQKVNAKILGVIVNNISLTDDAYSYPYYYSQYYKTAQSK